MYQKKKEKTVSATEKTIKLYNEADSSAIESCWSSIEHIVERLRRHVARIDGDLLVKRAFFWTLMEIEDVEQASNSEVLITMKRSANVNILVASTKDDGTVAFTDLVRDLI